MSISIALFVFSMLVLSNFDILYDTYTLRKEIPQLDDDIEEGKFSILISWLRKNIHEKANFKKISRNKRMS